MNKLLRFTLFLVVFLGSAYALGAFNSAPPRQEADSSSSAVESRTLGEALNQGMALTTGGEELLSFDYGAVGSDVLVRKNNAFILRVYYGDKADGKGYNWDIPGVFDYIETKGIADGVNGDTISPFLSPQLFYVALEQDKIVSEAHTRYPLAGVTPYENIKRLRINGRPVEQVHEYVDEQGHTWYLWYYHDFKLPVKDINITLD